MTNPIDDARYTRDNLPEPGDEDFLDSVDDASDQELIDAATAELPDEDVAAEDLSVQDLINDGIPVEDLEFSAVGRREFDADFEDPEREDTIDERLRQEEPDPTSSIVPPRGGELAADAEEDPNL